MNTKETKRDVGSQKFRKSISFLCILPINSIG
jgi:hypothetical protein